jgi:hypothetical protein
VEIEVAREEEMAFVEANAEVNYAPDNYTLNPKP